jgi:hypothetical protein
VRELIARRLRARGDELGRDIFERIRPGKDARAGGEDTEYLAGLRAAVAASLEYGLSAIEHGEDAAGAPPPQTLSQARRAARTGVSVDTVLRRYVLGSRLLGEALMREAAVPDIAEQGGGALREMLSAQAVVLERLLGAITAEHAAELECIARSPAHYRAQLVKRLLAGEHVDPDQLGYDLDAQHLAAIATGSQASRALERIASRVGARLLCVPGGEDTAWAWFGAARPLASRELERLFSCSARAGVCISRDSPRPRARGDRLAIALGEAAEGVQGWRVSHRQAQAALRVALRTGKQTTRYAEVALHASLLEDEQLANSLVKIYLAPLGPPDHTGAILRETLRAYLAAEHNASSAAAALRVTRQTVEKRMRTIEEKLGAALRTNQAELEVALRLEKLGPTRQSK